MPPIADAPFNLVAQPRGLRDDPRNSGGKARELRPSTCGLLSKRQSRGSTNFIAAQCEHAHHVFTVTRLTSPTLWSFTNLSYGQQPVGCFIMREKVQSGMDGGIPIFLSFSDQFEECAFSLTPA